MSVVLALVSALAYGISDFLGGLFAKRISPWQVAVVGQASAAVCVAAAGVVGGGDPSPEDWWWGAFAGLGGGFGAAFLYRGLSSGRMGVVAPISAIGSALVPVAIGLLTGDRPSAVAWIGIVCALPAILLISRSDAPAGDATGAPATGVVDGVLAGLGFGLLFSLVGQISPDAGLLPLALSQVTSVLAVIATASVLRAAWVPRARSAYGPVILGPLGALATGAFLYATHHGLLSIVSVIASLYPATTVLLATVVLRERIHRPQAVGLGLAAAAVSLVALG